MGSFRRNRLAEVGFSGVPVCQEHLEFLSLSVFLEWMGQANEPLQMTAVASRVCHLPHETRAGLWWFASRWKKDIVEAVSGWVVKALVVIR